MKKFCSLLLFLLTTLLLLLLLLLFLIILVKKVINTKTKIYIFHKTELNEELFDIIKIKILKN